MASTATMESWESTVETTMYLKVTDPRGRESHIKTGGRVGARLMITAEDRELNQLETADPEWDVFTNGMLVPIRKTVAETPELKTANALTAEELAAMLALTGAAFSNAVGKLTSETTLRRLKELAVSVDARPSQMLVIDSALEPFAVKRFSSKAGVPDVGPGSEL